MTPIQQLIDLDWRTRCAGSKMPPEYLVGLKKKFSDKTAPELEACIERWCKLNGWLCERVKNTGRWLDKSYEYTDVVGNRKSVKDGKYIKGTGTNGTSDCRAVIYGFNVSIEVKIGKDRQSEAQIKYQDWVEKSMGYYIVVKTFEDFYNYFNMIIEKLKRYRQYIAYFEKLTELHGKEYVDNILNSL